MSEGTIYVDCPCCGARLEVEREGGKVVQKWDKPQKAPAGGDPIKAALEKMEADKKKRATFFSGAKDSLEEEKRRTREKFEKEKERIKREKDTTRPPNIFDLD